MSMPIIIIFSFALLAFLLGISARRGKDMDIQQFAVGNRGFGALLVFLLVAGEVYTTFTFLGGSGWAYSKGAAAFYVPAYVVLAYVLSYWLAPRIWRFAKDRGAVSQPDYFAIRYQSKAFGIIVAIVGCMALIPYITIQLKGLGIIVSEASYGVIPPALASFIGALIVMTYMIISGIHSSAWTAIIKDFLILVVAIFMGLYIPFHYYGGIQPMFEQIQAVAPEKLVLPEQGLGISWFISTVLVNAIGFYLLPQNFSVVLTANGEKSLRKNAITLPLYTLLLLFIFFIGYSAILQIPGLQEADGDLSLLRLSIQTFDPWFVGIIGAAGLLTALVPASVMIISGSVGLTKSVYMAIVPHASEKQQLVVSRVFILIMTASAFLFSIIGGNALAILNIMSYTLIVQLAPALVFGFFPNSRVNKYGAAAGILTGVLIVLWATLFDIQIADFIPSVPHAVNDINVGALALVVNIAVTLGVSFVTNLAASRGEATEAGRY